MDTQKLTIEDDLRSRIRVLEQQLARIDTAQDPYRALFSAIPDGLVIVDDDGRYIDVNDAYARLLRSTRSDIIGRHFLDFMPEDRREDAQAAFAELKMGGPGLPEFPLRAVDGTIVPCEWTVHSHFVPGVSLCSARDITQRKAVEQRLKASESRFRAAASAVSSLLWTNNAQGQMEGDQPGWAAFTGQTVQEYSGYGWAKALHPEDAQPTIDAWNEAVSKRQMFIFEHRVRRSDGVYRLFSIRAVPIVDEFGAVSEWVGVHTDITDERQLTEVLRQNERHFRFLTQLDDATRSLENPEQITSTAARMLGQHLEADSVSYCHFDEDQETFHIVGDYTVPAAPSMIGDYQLKHFGSALVESLRANQPFIVPDIETDPRTVDMRPAYRKIGIRANLAVPLHKGGRLVGAMGVHQLAPRAWTPRELELLQQVANRCWESMERTRAQMHFRQQWQTFDTALSNTPDFTYTFDLDGRFSYVNRALLSLWRKPLEEALGKNFLDLDYPPELAERLQRQIQETIHTKAAVRDHTPFTDPAGNIGYYEYIFVPVFDPDGRVSAVAGSTRDITDREKMARALAASEKKLQQVFTQAPVAIVVFRGSEFNVELANPFYEAFFKGRKLIGRPFADVVPELGDYVWNALRRVLSTGEPFVANEFLVPYDQDLDGQVEDHWFNVVYHPLREADDSVSGVVAVCSEVTVQVRARQDLERVNRELEEFGYVASHDLQEPLRMVGIFTELLLQQFLPENAAARQYGAFIHDGVRRMEKLIHDLLTYSRVIHNDGSTFEKADLNESLSQALKTLENRIQETGAKVIVDPLPTVAGDFTQLAHVFQNLLSNSLKYREPTRTPEIRISAERNNGRTVVVSVSDNGIGFEQHHAERIFGLFKRLHKDEYSGTGLGLAICQRILERYGGKIWAEGRPGQGATFYFTLPGVSDRETITGEQHL